MDISLVIPLKNEEFSLVALIKSILAQQVAPDEVIFVDGGSTDRSVEVLQQYVQEYKMFRIIQVTEAMPGEGRNIGTGNASHDWIAYTDGGISLDKCWLLELKEKALKNPGTAIVYGNSYPIVDNFFKKCAAITYVSPEIPGKIREKFIASSLIRKEVWEKAGGFPGWRAAEDLVFMENAEKHGAFITAPDARVNWELRPDVKSTFKRFDLYSKYNVWAGRQRFWHYGVVRQYLVMFCFALAGILHSPFWLLGIPGWMAARTAKRIWMHRNQFGIITLFKPAVFLLVFYLLCVLDIATFSGWLKALISKNPLQRISA